MLHVFILIFSFTDRCIFILLILYKLLRNAYIHFASKMSIFSELFLIPLFKLK